MHVVDLLAFCSAASFCIYALAGHQPTKCVLTTGEFAEAVRSQFMEERMDYFRAVEAAIYEESGFQVPAALHATSRTIMVYCPASSLPAVAFCGQG